MPMNSERPSRWRRSLPEIGIDTVIQPSIETTGGWDAYEVWRRFIKDARDRRKHQDSN